MPKYVSLFLASIISTCVQADFNSQTQDAINFGTTGDVMAAQEALKNGINPYSGQGLGLGTNPCAESGQCGGQAFTPTDNPAEASYYNQAPSQLDDASRIKAASDPTSKFQMDTAIERPVGVVGRDDPIFKFNEQNEAAITPLSQSYSGCATVKAGGANGSSNFKTCYKSGVPNVNHCYRSWSGRCEWINDEPVSIDGHVVTRVKEEKYYSYDDSGAIKSNISGTPFYHYTLPRVLSFTLNINKRMLNANSILHLTSSHFVPDKKGCGACGIPSLKINGEAVSVKQSYYVASKGGYHTATFYNLANYIKDGSNTFAITIDTDGKGANLTSDPKLLNLYDIKECIKHITEHFSCDADQSKVLAKPRVRTICLDNQNPKWIDGQAFYRDGGCWSQDEQHGYVNTALYSEDTQCKQYRAEQCEFVKEDCLSKHQEGWCSNAKLTFNCAGGTGQQQVEVCGDTLICPDGNCYDQLKEKGDSTEDFKQVATYTELMKNAKDNFDVNSLSVFKGKFKECTVNKTLIGSDSCCVGGSGALNTLGKKCNVNEQEIADARNNKIVTFLRSWEECSNKVAGICVEKLIHYEYCVWPSKLARMIQDQGMAQLGQAISTDCRGFKLNAPNEIGMLDFEKIDLSEYFTDVVNKLNATTLPDPNVMLNQTEASIPAMTDKLNERYKDYGR